MHMLLLGKALVFSFSTVDLHTILGVGDQFTRLAHYRSPLIGVIWGNQTVFYIEYL